MLNWELLVIKPAFTTFAAMRVRHFLNIFLILVLLGTVLPIKQVGKLLSSNQLIEEIMHGDNPEKKSGQAYQLFYCFFGCKTDHGFLVNKQHAKFAYYDACLPIQPAGEILVPPPNWC